LPHGCRYGCDILSGLAALHANGILMLDLKPQNVLLDEDDRAVLADFSLARVLSEGETHVSVSDLFAQSSAASSLCIVCIVGRMFRPDSCFVLPGPQAASGGTLAYMAPEQFGSGVVRPAADMWGFGATMRHLLSGKALPANWVILGEALDLQLPAEAQAVPGLATLLKQCLQTAPQDRPSCAKAYQRLRDMLSDHF
jgi:serine/threonine protein kinase